MRSYLTLLWTKICRLIYKALNWGGVKYGKKSVLHAPKFMQILLTLPETHHQFTTGMKTAT